MKKYFYNKNVTTMERQKCLNFFGISQLRIRKNWHLFSKNSVDVLKPLVNWIYNPEILSDDNWDSKCFPK